MTKLILSFLFFLIACMTNLYAEESSDFADEGERRVQEASGHLIGKLAPQNTFKTIDGKPVELSEMYGKKPVYLKFWATWCVPCRQQMPEFESMYQEFGDKIEFIAVNTGFNDDIAAVEKYLKTMSMNMPILIDNGTLRDVFNAQVTPMHVLINKQGKISYVGHKDGEDLHAALNGIMQDDDYLYIIPEENLSKDNSKEIALENLMTIQNERISLGADNLPAALVFLAPWCEWYLEASRPQMAELCKSNRLLIDRLVKQRNDITWVGISTNIWTNKQDVLDYQTNTKTILPLVFDQNSNIFKHFDVVDVPSVVLIDKSGKKLKLSTKDVEYLEEFIDETIAK